MRVPSAPHPCQPLAVPVLFPAVLIDVWFYHIEIFFFFFSLMGTEVEHLFMCLSDILISSLVKCLSPHSGQNGHHQKVYNQSMLERVWRKGNPPTLLVGMQTSTATMENSVEIP